MAGIAITDLVTLHLGDCLDVMCAGRELGYGYELGYEPLRLFSDASIDAIVTDPPYGLGFMGKAWDALPPGREWAEECLRVLKPGGYLLAFGGSRTWHRLAVAVEDAGFELRDSIAWLYGSGFPKSHDVSKAIDKAAGAEREVIGSRLGLPGVSKDGMNQGDGFSRRLEGRADRPSPALDITAPATEAARQWQGWGTALKPAFEPIVVGRKPLAGTVAVNVLQHGTGALNIDGCRVTTDDGLVRPAVVRRDNSVLGHGLGLGSQEEPGGRWPPNVVLDGSQADELDQQSGFTRSPGKPVTQGRSASIYGGGAGFSPEGHDGKGVGYGDAGGASRYFPTFRYQAKAPAKERPKLDGVTHPTVKPLELMRWLVRLVTPPGGIVLDPFSGSGTTAEACQLEGFQCVVIERETAYLPLILQRLMKAPA